MFQIYFLSQRYNVDTLDVLSSSTYHEEVEIVSFQTYKEFVNLKFVT